MTHPSCQPWGDPTGHHLVLAGVVQLPEPVPARGALGLPWRLTEDVEASVRGQRALAQIQEATP